MKSHFSLAQALLAQRHVEEALLEAECAYSICLKTRNSSTEVVSKFILRAKLAQWESKETARLREMNETLALVEDLLNQQLLRDARDVDDRFAKHEIGETGKREEMLKLEMEANTRRSNIRKQFQDLDNPDSAERVCCDPISKMECRWILIAFRLYQTG